MTNVALQPLDLTNTVYEGYPIDIFQPPFTDEVQKNKWKKTISIIFATELFKNTDMVQKNLNIGKVFILIYNCRVFAFCTTV
jgi:hypothetical protein